MRATTGATAGLGVAFLLCFTGLAEATSGSEGRFSMVFPQGTTTFKVSPFIISGAFARLTGVFPAAPIFFFSMKLQ
jgi:hypothetical protein